MKKVLAIITGILGILLVVTGVRAKAKKAVAVSIIGGVDGPTSVFIAGKLGTDISLGLIIAGVILIAVMSVLWLRKRRK